MKSEYIYGNTISYFILHNIYLIINNIFINYYIKILR